MEVHVVVLLLLAGFFAGYVDTIAGGGGLITVPAYLMAGLPAHLALGTNKFSATFSVANAARIFIKKNIFKPRYWIAAIIASLLGALLGAVVVHFANPEFLKKFIPIIMLVLVVYIFWPKKFRDTVNQQYQPKRLSSALIASCLGFYDGFIGPGTGSFWVVALMYFYKMEIIEATGVAKLMNFLSNFAALVVFISFANVDYWLGLMMAVSMMTGAYFGAHSAIRFGAKFIKPAFLSIVTVMAIRLLWQYW